MKKKEYTLGEITLETLTEDECVQENCDELCERWMDVIDCELDINQVNENNCEQLIDAYEAVVQVLTGQSYYTDDLAPYNRAIRLGADLCKRMLDNNSGGKARRVLGIIAVGLKENFRIAQCATDESVWDLLTFRGKRFEGQNNPELETSLGLLIRAAKETWMKEPGTLNELLLIMRGMLLSWGKVKAHEEKNYLKKRFKHKSEDDFWGPALWLANQIAATIIPGEKEYDGSNDNARDTQYVLDVITDAFERGKNIEEMRPSELLYLANIYKRIVVLYQVCGYCSNKKRQVDGLTKSLEYGKRALCVDKETVDICKAVLRQPHSEFPKGYKMAKYEELEELERLKEQGTIISK